MKIEVFGTGCAKCKRMYDNAVEAVKKAEMIADVVKVDSLDEIVNRGVLMTPSLFVDGEEVVAGRVPTVHEIMTIITEGA